MQHIGFHPHLQQDTHICKIWYLLFTTVFLLFLRSLSLPRLLLVTTEHGQLIVLNDHLQTFKVCNIVDFFYLAYSDPVIWSAHVDDSSCLLMFRPAWSDLGLELKACSSYSEGPCLISRLSWMDWQIFLAREGAKRSIADLEGRQCWIRWIAMLNQMDSSTDNWWFKSA